MLSVLRDSVFLEFLLAVEHSLAERLEVYVESLGLGQQFVFFFSDVMPHAFREDGEFRLAMVSTSPIQVEFGDENLGDVMLLVGLIHNVRSDMLSHGWVKDLLFDHRVHIELGDRPVEDPFLLGGGFGFFEPVKRSLTVS